ncbi:ABC-type transport system involved in multi-copper enzyme maturation, permease component [Bhargavaea cecembensis DSE10]|uniref:ABC-type transport system involved in multi-copper enzyme maturation, permease component n=1 Tax=Bhargavaea cecembensis DSE10 TaxID=1235279 RepID=M7P6Y1_9BACL|nr:ABC transporter permease subunit [Bhargavaea cecembensis]EMR06264.1 ABC-type transport system involved in multi-copper enzyme maturation, permease component [Bhargavaea cecembensis DSE10]
MNQYRLFLGKEWREQARSFKLFWVPLVFIFFGALEPLTYHFLPQILESVGNLPEGSEFTLPEMTGADVYASLTGQYQTVGLLVLVLAFMGSLSGERKSGTGTLLYVRPISYAAYYLSKWTSAVLLGAASLWLGYGMAATYIVQLYDQVPDLRDVVLFLLVMAVWIVFVVTLTLTASASLPTGGAAGAALGILFIGMMIDGLVGTYWTWSPWKLQSYGLAYLTGGPDTGDLAGALIVTAVLTALLALFGILQARRNAAKAKV